MFKWIGENWATLVVGAVVIALAALAVIKLVRDKKAGKSSCGCGCANCPMSGSCHKKAESKK